MSKILAVARMQGLALFAFHMMQVINISFLFIFEAHPVNSILCISEYESGSMPLVACNFLFHSVQLILII